MDFDDVIKKRRSVKYFSGKKVSWKDVLEAVDAARQGPFAGNNNNLRFIIVEDEDKIKDIAGLCDQDWITGASIVVVVMSDDRNLENIYGERGRVYSRQQAGAAIITFLLKLVDLGLGACWVGSYTDELLRQKMKIPGHFQIEAVIPIGYEKKVPGVKEKQDKKDLENSIYWEEWDKSKRPTLFEEDKKDYRPIS